MSLFRLVKCLDLGQQEPGEALQLLLGHAVPRVLGGRRCLCCCLFLPIFRSGSFLQGCPPAALLLVLSSILTLGPLAALLTVQPFFLLLAAADAQHKCLHLLRRHPHGFPVRTGLGEHRIQLFLAAVEALA